MLPYQRLLHITGWSLSVSIKDMLCYVMLCYVILPLKLILQIVEYLK